MRSLSKARSPARGKTVSQREVLDLPLNGRNFSQLGLLQPGVVPLTPGLAEAGGTLREGQAYAVNGQRPESNNFLIDGANNFNGVDGGFVLKPPVDAITEFRILTHNANAEFGNSLGSTTNIITRSREQTRFTAHCGSFSGTTCLTRPTILRKQLSR